MVPITHVPATPSEEVPIIRPARSNNLRVIAYVLSRGRGSPPRSASMVFPTRRLFVHVGDQRPRTVNHRKIAESEIDVGPSLYNSALRRDKVENIFTR